MKDVISPKRSSLKPRLIAATMFLKLNMSPIPNNPVDVTESPSRNTLIPSRRELPKDIDDSDDNNNDDDDDEEEEEDDDDTDDDDKDDDLSPVQVESEEADYTC